MTHRVPRLLALTAALAAAAAVAVATPASAAPTGTQGLQYVALGDSYAAGFGITPSIPAPPAPATGCLQAQANYPHQVAAQLGLDLVSDATCTGAVTANVIGTDQITETYFGGGTARPQSQSLSADTDVVTVSIGGNDAGFSSVVAACIAFSAAGPTLSGQANCQTAYTVGGVDTLAQLIQTTVATNLATTYAAIRQAAPNAAVFVVGYPSLMPDAANTPAGGCFTPVFYQSTPPPSGPPFYADSVPFTDNDVAWIHGIEVLLDQTIAAAAATAGFTFVDTLPGSVANSVCPQTGDPFIEGITFRSLNFSDLPLTENGGMHPTASGISYLTAQTAAAIAAAFPDPAPAPQPVLAASGAEGAAVIALAAASGALMLGGIVALLRSRRTRASGSGR